MNTPEPGQLAGCLADRADVTAACTVAPVDAVAWDQLVPRFPGCSVFHHGPWLELLAETYGLRLLRLVAHDRSGEPVGLLPVLEQRKGPFRVVGSPLPGWNTAYLGPLFAAHAEPLAVCRSFLATDPLRSASYLDLRVRDLADGIDLAELGCTKMERFETYVLPLEAGEEELWEGLDGKCRNMVRKGTRSFEVREEHGDEWIVDFTEMLAQVFARWELRPPCDRTFLENMARLLRPAGQIAVRSAFVGDRRAATAVILRDGHTAYYWMGATFDEYRQQGPNNLLLWEAIRAAKASGCSAFDFVSASGSAGKFKASFGPKLVAVSNRWSKSRTVVEAWLKTGYEGLLRWRRRMQSAS